MKEVHQRNIMAEQPKYDVSELQFEKFPVPCTLHCWKIHFKTEVCSGSSHRKEAMPWIKEVEMANSVGDLKSSQYFVRTRLSKYRDARREDRLSVEK